MSLRNEIRHLELGLDGKSRFVECYDKGHVGPIQQFTEICLGCGENSYMTLEEYRDRLLQKTEEGRQKLRQRRQEIQWTAAIEALSVMPKDELRRRLEEKGMI